jgi:hypothetical protein
MIRHHNRHTEQFLPSHCPAKAGWRVKEWTIACGLSRAHVYNLLKRGALDSVKDGKARIITTSPAHYLASLASE